MKNILIALLFTGNAFAQLTYEYGRKLEKINQENFYSIPLPPEITAHCKSGLNDIRLYTFNENDTTEIPYILEKHGDKTEELPISFELINDVTNLKCCSFVTLKMNEKKIINKITLDVLENNFDKILKIEGSNDNKEWFLIKDHLRITGFVNAENDFRSTSINFPSSEFTYFRVAFDDDASNRVTITKAYAFENRILKGNYNNLPVKDKKQSDNKKEKTSEFIIELADNYFIDHIVLKSKTGNDFYRNINIFSSAGTFHTPKGDEEAWQMVSSGIITSNEENVFSLNDIQSKKLKLEVINYDNEPISLEEISVFSEKITLTSRLPLTQVYLFYGKENTEAPVYDLVHFKNKIPLTISFVALGNEEIRTIASMNNPTEPMIKNKLWLWLMMGVIILLIGYFALNMLKKDK
jgi:hypothetical protein